MASERGVRDKGMRRENSFGPARGGKGDVDGNEKQPGAHGRLYIKYTQSIK